VPEVMRGEETAAMGMLDDARSGLVCFPGTHSKWIQLSDHTIVSFATWMTGEVYSALRRCTILERMMTSGDTAIDHAAFQDGVARSADSAGCFTIFSACVHSGLDGAAQRRCPLRIYRVC
jgi:2-dehydro-3-deoxygalactonokinase